MSNKTSDKNVATEEDVKVLKDLMEELKLEKQTDLHNNEYGEYITECDVLDLYDKQILALQHILAEREQKDKRIQELEEENAMLKKTNNIGKNINIDDVTKVINKSYDEFMSNYISKQVVKDKIEKIEKEYNDIMSDYGNIDTDVIINVPNKNVRKHLDELVTKIFTLQELLGGESK